MKLYELTIAAARQLLKEKQVSSQELVTAVFDRIAEVEDRVGAYITLCRETALAEAAKADARIAAGDTTPSPEFRFPSRILFALRGFGPPAGQKFWPILSRPMMQPS